MLVLGDPALHYLQSARGARPVNKRYWLFGAAIIVFARSTGLHAQQFRIAVNVTEHGAVVTSQLSAALRSLGDVVVVTTAEPHDYRLDGVMLCLPSDERCETFAVALTLLELFDSVSGTQVLSVALSSPRRPLSHAQDSTLARTLSGLTRDYGKSLGLWVTLWPRATVTSSASTFVSELDQNCLEWKRMERRMYALMIRGDTAASRALSERLHDPKIARTLACV